MKNNLTESDRKICEEFGQHYIETTVDNFKRKVERDYDEDYIYEYCV